MSLNLRAFMILLFVMQAFVYQETIRVHYRTSIQNMAPYLLAAVLMVILAPWVSTQVLLGLLLLFLIGCVVLYRDHYIDHAFFLGSYLLSGYILYAISKGFTQPDQIFVIWLLGCLLCAIAQGIQLLYLSHKNEDYDQIYVTPFLIAFLLYAIIVLYLLNHIEDSDGILVLCMQALFMLFLYFYRVCFTQEVRREKELEAMKKTHRVVENRERYDRIQKENAYIMKSMHDLRKHVELLSQLDESSEIVENYAKTIRRQADQMLAIQKTGDELIDKVLQLYHPKFQEAGIRFQLESDVIDYTFMDPVDRCAVLTNLFDNALKSCQNSPQPFILFRMVEQGPNILWKMKNSCRSVERDCEEAFAHGFGLENVKDIATHYHGSLSTLYEEEHHIYKTTVLFEKPVVSENEPLV